MPQSIAGLTQYGAGYIPLADGLEPTRRTGFEGVPFLGGTGFPGAVASVALTPMYQRLLSQVGMVPVGMGHDQNIYDVMRSQQFMQTQQQAVAIAAKADRAGYMRSMEGLAALTGTPFGADQRRAADNIAGAVTSLSPLLAQQMPELLDTLGGRRGSAAVLAQNLAEAGRYRVDAVTGRLGMSGESAGQMAGMLQRDLFSDKNIASMQGITAGKLGELIQALQSRGRLDGLGTETGYRVGADGTREYYGTRETELRRAVAAVQLEDPQKFATTLSKHGIASADKLTAQDLDKLTLDPAVADKLRAFDAERVKRSVKGYTAAVAAMRDIFGDMGHANAPMQELIAGLEAMTLGQSQQLSPDKLSSLVRQTHNLAKAGGVSMDKVLMMQQQAAAEAAQLGLNPLFAVSATQGALAYNGAIQDANLTGKKAWNVMTADELVQAERQDLLRGATSNVANQYAALMRIEKEVGGFEEGSRPAQIAEAIRSRTYDPSMRMSQPEFVEMMRKAKSQDGEALSLTDSDIQSVIYDRESNQQYVYENRGITEFTRRGMSEDVWRVIGNSMSSTMASRLSGQLQKQTPTLSGAEATNRATQMSADISSDVMQQIRGLSNAEMSDPDVRSQRISEIVDTSLRSHGHADFLDKMTIGERRNFTRLMAGSMVSNSDRSLSQSGYSNWGNTVNAARRTNEMVLNNASQRDMQAELTGQLQESLSGLGQGTVLSRAVDELQNVDVNDSDKLYRVAAKALGGGVDREQVHAALLKPTVELAKKRREVEQLHAAVANEKDSGKQAELLAQIDTKRKELTQQVELINTASEKLGLGQNPTRTDARGALESQRGVTDTYDKYASLQQGKTAEEVRKMDADFFASEEGAAYRRRVQRSTEDVENTAMHLVDSPAVTQKYGTRAIEMSRQLNQSQSRLRDLAHDYSGNDMAKFMLGKYEFGFDTATPEGEAKAAKLSADLDAQRNAILSQQRDIYKEIYLGERNTGRQLQKGDERDALRSVLLDANPAMSDAELETELGKLDSDEDKRVLADTRVVESDDAKLRQELGLPADMPVDKMTPWEQTRLAAATHGATSEDTLAAVYGKARWYGQKTEEEREVLRSRLLHGTHDEDAAAELLLGDAASPERVAELRQKQPELVRSVAQGLASDKTARDLAGVAAKGTLNPADAERVSRVTLGATSEAFARHKTGLADKLDAATRNDVEARRIQMGDSREALRLMSRQSDSRLTPEEAQEHKRLTQEVNLARKLTADDVTLLDRFGKYTEEQQNTEAYKGDEAKLNEQMQRYGLDPADVTHRERMLGAGKVWTAIGEEGRKELERQTMSGETALRETLTAFGFRPPAGELSEKQREVSEILNTDYGRQHAQELMGRHAINKTYAKRWDEEDVDSGVAAMTSQYQAAKGDVGELRKFQEKAGIDTTTDEGKKQWGSLERSMQFELDRGYAGIGGRHGTEHQLYDRMTTYIAGADMQTNRPAEKSGPVEIVGNLTGTLSIKGETADFAGAAGGDRAYTVPGGN